MQRVIRIAVYQSICQMKALRRTHVHPHWKSLPAPQSSQRRNAASAATQPAPKLEQELSEQFTRLEIRGKRGRKVPVLLTKRVTASLDLLNKYRSEVGVPEDNPYVFARVEAMTPIRGADCLRKFADACKAAHPERLRSTKLRKHVATLCQIMNLKDNEMDQVAKFMGHDIRVHREYYRMTENTLQLAKMSRVLMAIEQGTHTYKGKSLD